MDKLFSCCTCDNIREYIFNTEFFVEFSIQVSVQKVCLYSYYLGLTWILDDVFPQMYQDANIWYGIHITACELRYNPQHSLIDYDLNNDYFRCCFVSQICMCKLTVLKAVVMRGILCQILGSLTQLHIYEYLLIGWSTGVKFFMNVRYKTVH